MSSVTVEWRRGTNGDQGTYIFSPNPSLRRSVPGKRSVTLIVPLMDGVVIQNFAKQERSLQLAGVLYTQTNSWDDVETLRNNLINGIGLGPGQLHIISAQRHIRYDGQITPEGIVFEPQSRLKIQDYALTMIVPTGVEINVTETSRTISSNAEIV